MRTFTDSEGREWSVAVNVSTIKRVRGLIDVDLLDVLGGKLVERFISDPVVLCDTLYAVCKPQADERGVSDEDFGRAMSGDAIEHATKALLGELVSFCPSPRDRKHLGLVLEKTEAAMEKARDVVSARIESGELDRAIDQAIDKAAHSPPTPGISSGDARASPASTRTD
jgi:hypothetical protein